MRVSRRPLAALLGGLPLTALLPLFALSWSDFQAPPADRMPFRVEEVELSVSQRDEVVMGLIALARNHCPDPLTTTEGVMALALAQALDPDQPALVQSWEDLPAGQADPVHVGGDLDELLDLGEALAAGLSTDQANEQSRIFARYLVDLSARCRARLHHAEMPRPEADWHAFFPDWENGRQPPGM